MEWHTYTVESVQITAPLPVLTTYRTNGENIVILPRTARTAGSQPMEFPVTDLSDIYSRLGRVETDVSALKTDVGTIKATMLTNSAAWRIAALILASVLLGSGGPIGTWAAGIFKAVFG